MPPALDQSHLHKSGACHPLVSSLQLCLLPVKYRINSNTYYKANFSMYMLLICLVKNLVTFFQYQMTRMQSMTTRSSINQAASINFSFLLLKQFIKPGDHRIAFLNQKQSSIQTMGYPHTFNLSRFWPYMSITVVPLCITPVPVIIHVPDLMLVIVEGKSRSFGEWRVTPISMDPAHLSTILSI